MKDLSRIIYHKALIFNVYGDIMAQNQGFCATFSPQIGAFFLQLLSILVLLNLSISSPAQKRNPYHLPLTTTKKAYRQQVDSNNSFRMVLLPSVLPGLKTDIRYQTRNNFTGQVLYKKPMLYLRKAAADRLVLVQDSLNKTGLTILVFDAYRPYATTLKMWEVVPDDRYAANPANGSGHNRGIAIDLTLADAQTGEALKMPTDFDNFSDTAHHDFQQLDSSVLANRATLKNIMTHFGFIALDTEWWHYYLPEPRRYPLMDLSFRQLRRVLKRQTGVMP